MGNIFKSSCKYNSGWNKGNACPPGFTVTESCSWWSSTITCEAPKTGFDSRAVPVSARFNMNGACTSDPTSPDSGGATPTAPPSCPNAGGVSIGTRLTPCCELGFGACTPKGWANLAMCADAVGDMVFDVRNPTSCTGKFDGLSNNFAAQEWCKDAGMDNCWLPYSMQADNSCIPYNKDSAGQWDKSSGWTATSKKGGAEIVLVGAVPVDNQVFKNGGSDIPPSRKLDVGSIGATAGGGAMCVVGLVLVARKKKKKQKSSASELEISGGAGQV
ncbi:hypothetical protein TL16_g06347 [Triparma laevis f. inornata]|uniref:Uncharacterized protein n=2 Tax=Triparma laevis TaxID=1534972 RepID=A0A9W7CEP9_9STRA|nr:hypothetical protein TL16_g06347 [Triparma laevis f. inornata]GMI04761.1 hypothetical protein TrLO_g13953 [Triparma laevis f. longispina]